MNEKFYELARIIFLTPAVANRQIVLICSKRQINIFSNSAAVCAISGKFSKADIWKVHAEQSYHEGKQ